VVFLVDLLNGQPSRSATRATGVPCESVPLTMRTEFPFKRW